MRKTLSLFALFMLAFICPAAAQVVIDEITIQGAESYTVNQEMVVRFKVNNNSGVPLAADDYSLSVNVGGVYAGKPAATKDIANGSYESFMAKVAPHKAGENLPVQIVFKGMGTTTAAAEQTVTVNPEVPSGDVQIGNCAKPSSDTDYTNVLNTYYNYSQTEIVYTAADLDLADGTNMTGLSFTGYRTNERIVPVKVWVELTDDVTPQSTGKTTMYTSENLIKVYDDNYSFKVVGDSYAHEPVFSITFPTPIQYVAGKSLRVIVQTEKASSYSYTYISVDKTKSGQVATRCVDSSMEGLLAKAFKADSYGTPYYLPVLKLAIEKEPTVVSGQVYIYTKNYEVAYPENATVTLANGNVMYMAQTDEDGNYSMTVCQDKLTYDVTVEPADYTIFPYKETLALNGTSTTKNIGLKEAAGAYIMSAEFPETGVENSSVTVKANIYNYEADDMDDTNAKVILKLDGKQVAEAEDLLIDAFDNDNVTLTFTPHVSGEKELTVEVYINGVLQSSKSGNITISKESATNDFTIKGSEATANETTSPIRLYSTHSYSQTLLTSDMLNGLAAGSKITGLKLESAQSKNTKNFNFDVKVWVMNTEDGADNVTTDPHSSDFKQVYSATLVQRYHGNYSENGTTYEKFIDLVFDEPFVYEGKNIRIAMRADVQSSYQTTYFKALKDVRTSYTKSADNPKIDGVAVDIMDYTWATSAAQTPVFTFVVDNASIVTGTVVNKDTQAPIANAEVKLTANDGADIVYTATTDAEGKFEVSVIQASHSFTASVSAEGYNAVENAGSISADFESPFNLGTIELEALQGAVVNINSTIGYATFYDSEHAVKIPAGVKAYFFSQPYGMERPALLEYEAYYEEYMGEPYEGVVPAGEPIVLQGAGDVVLEYATTELETMADYGVNYLAGTDEDALTTNVYGVDCYYYALTLNKAKDPESVGFYWMNETGTAFTNKAHKAYLAIPKEMFDTDDVKQAFRFNDDAATAIKNVNTSANSTVNATFNLAGQRVNGNAKGIVIKNGKKFMVK